MILYELLVYMDEDDDWFCFYSYMSIVVEEVLDEESIFIIYRSLFEYKELLQFKKLKKQKF